MSSTCVAAVVYTYSVFQNGSLELTITGEMIWKQHHSLNAYNFASIRIMAVVGG